MDVVYEMTRNLMHQRQLVHAVHHPTVAPVAVQQHGNEVGLTIHQAAALGRTDIVSSFLDASHGESLERLDGCGRTPLHVAAANGRAAVVDLLLRYGADPQARMTNVNNSNNTSTLVTPLHMAATGHLACLRLLLAAGAKHSARTTGRLIPLHVAAHAGAIECLRVLLAAGSEIEARDINGMTPLQGACEMDMTVTAAELLRTGARLETRDNRGCTAVHFAAAVNGFATLQLLLAVPGGVNLINVQDVNGLTPLHYACGMGAVDTARLLLEAGAIEDVKDSRNMTPYSRAIYRQQQGIISLFRLRAGGGGKSSSSYPPQQQQQQQQQQQPKQQQDRDSWAGQLAGSSAVATAPATSPKAAFSAPQAVPPPANNNNGNSNNNSNNNNHLTSSAATTTTQVHEPPTFNAAILASNNSNNNNNNNNNINVNVNHNSDAPAGDHDLQYRKQQKQAIRVVGESGLYQMYAVSGETTVGALARAIAKKTKTPDIAENFLATCHQSGASPQPLDPSAKILAVVGGWPAEVLKTGGSPDYYLKVVSSSSTQMS